MEILEQPLVFDCAEDRLLGVLARPMDGNATASLGLVVVVGGPQYRVGSHRQFARLARHVAAQGFAALRFDVRGKGDSDGDARSFEALDQDIAAAIDALAKACPGVTRVALWGLCDGASAALLYRHRSGDERVVALGLVNPWVRSEATLARARMRHYYLERLADRRMWADFFGMRMQFREALADLWRNWRRARHPAVSGAESGPFREQMAAGLANFRGPVLLLLSGRDATAQEFRDCIQSDTLWQSAIVGLDLTRVDLAEADHTFTDKASREAMESATSEWLSRL